MGDSWPTGKIIVIVPTSLTTTQTVQSPRITATMYKPIHVDTTLALVATIDTPCYKVVTTVIAPDGTSSSGTTYNSTGSATYSYKFTQTGLYTIQVSAFESSSSTAVDYYYTIRTY